LGNPGWTLKTQTNIFAYADWKWNRPANAWYCMHLWQHYAYTNDLVFLSEKAFPVMKTTCEFWLDRLVLNADGKWEAPDEWSPEQGAWENGVSYAQQLIWELFDKTTRAAHILGIDDSFISIILDKFNNLDNGVAIGSWGQIKEWKEDKDNLDNSNNKHRHTSHLIALYPGDQISNIADAKYAEAVKVSLNARGDEGTGWSLAWKISLWARLFDGDHAYALLKQALNRSENATVVVSGGGVYDNLLCSHPPFQIDGNFGATAGIAEMLLQSNCGFIHLLPALPSAWPCGNFQGLRAQGDFTVNLAWYNSRPVSCSIYSGSGNDCTVYYQGMDKKTFSTEPGRTYTICFEKM
jgi:alpha-L-fucosidase 2